MSRARASAPVPACKFAVDQEVVVIGQGNRVVDIYRIAKIDRKSITLDGYEHTSFDLDGWERRTKGRLIMTRDRIEPVTAARREEVQRRDLWSKVDTLLGTHAGWEEREERRARITTETLTKLVDAVMADTGAAP